MCVLMVVSATVLPSVTAPWFTLVVGVRSVNVNHMERVRERSASVTSVIQVIRYMSKITRTHNLGVSRWRSTYLVAQPRHPRFFGLHNV